MELSESSQTNCNFCDILQHQSKTYQILSQALFNKYSSSQDFLYGQNIQKYIENVNSPQVIEFRDDIFLYENEEHFRKLYQKAQLPSKISYLAEYYKFHKEIPRIFVKPICENLNYYYDKKRKIEYYKIKRMLHEKKGTDSPFQISKESNQNQQSDNDSSASVNRNMTKMLNSHLLNSINNQIKNIHDQKTKIYKGEKVELDTILEINNYLKNVEEINFDDAEQQSYFLLEKQEVPSQLQQKLQLYQNTQKVKSNSQKIDKKQPVKSTDFQSKFNCNLLQMIKQKIQQKQSEPKKNQMYQETLKDLQNLRLIINSNQQKVNSASRAKNYQTQIVQNQQNSLDYSKNTKKISHIRSPTQIPVQAVSKPVPKQTTYRSSVQQMDKLKAVDTYKSLDLNHSKSPKKQLSKEMMQKPLIKKQRKVQSIYQLDQKNVKMVSINIPKQSLIRQPPKTEKNVKSVVESVKIFKPQSYQNSQIVKLLHSQRQPKKQRPGPKSMQLSPDYIQNLKSTNMVKHLKMSYDSKTLNKNIKFLFEKSLKEKQAKTTQKII